MSPESQAKVTVLCLTGLMLLGLWHYGWLFPLVLLRVCLGVFIGLDQPSFGL